MIDAQQFRECRRCGKRVKVTKSAHLRAHLCPHGKWCVRAYTDRRQGKRAEACEECFCARQLELTAGGNPIRTCPDE